MPQTRHGGGPAEKRSRIGIHSPEVDSQGEKNANCPQGGFGISQMHPGDAGKNPSGLQVADPDRCPGNNVPLEQGFQKHHHEFDCSQSPNAASQKKGVLHCRVHPRAAKQKGRPPEQGPRLTRLQSGPPGIQTNDKGIQLQSQPGSVCKQNKQEMQTVLFQEAGQNEPGRCLCPELGETQKLAESTMGFDPQMFGKNTEGSSNSPGVPPNVADCTLVEEITIDDASEAHHHEEQKSVPKPRKGRLHAPTTLGNPFHYNQGLNIPQFKTAVRNLECQHDVPTKVRIQWMQNAKVQYPQQRNQMILTQAIKRLQHADKKPKYTVFYDIKKLLDWSFDRNSTGPLVDKLIMQLRLTTLMRSVDVANIVWALFEQDGQYFIKTTSKQGSMMTYSVMGDTLKTLIKYLHQHSQFPGAYLIRCVHNCEASLTAERIAKRALLVMGSLGIDIHIFKAHSLRGAVATHLMQQGVPPNLVQARGGWASSATMDMYYNRLHQKVDWQGACEGQLQMQGKEMMKLHIDENSMGQQPITNANALEENAGKGISLGCAVLPLKSSFLKTTKEVENKEDEKESTAQAKELSVQGILRPLYDTEECPSCNAKMQEEATFRCMTCQKRVHVRCLGTKTKNRESTTASREPQYSTDCFMCQLQKSNAHHGSTRDLIVDVMGVCDP